jgi:hypothetical protein
MSAPDSLEEWPSTEGKLADAPFVHAIGQISLIYNFLEESAGMIFALCMPTTPAFSETLFHKMNNRDRIDLLSAIIETREQDEEAKSSLLHFINSYDICTDNRNILSHVIVEAARLSADTIPLSKKARNNASRTVTFHVSLQELRQVADELGKYFDSMPKPKLQAKTGHIPRKTHGLARAARARSIARKTSETT